MVIKSTLVSIGNYRKLCMLSTLLGTVLYANMAIATTIIAQHSENNGPVTEGWEITFPNGSVTTGPVDNNDGFKAWFVDDSSTATGSI